MSQNLQFPATGHTVDPGDDPPDRPDEAFPVLSKATIPPLVNGRYSKRRQKGLGAHEWRVASKKGRRQTSSTGSAHGQSSGGALANRGSVVVPVATSGSVQERLKNREVAQQEPLMDTDGIREQQLGGSHLLTVSVGSGLDPSRHHAVRVLDEHEMTMAQPPDPGDSKGLEDMCKDTPAGWRPPPLPDGNVHTNPAPGGQDTDMIGSVEIAQPAAQAPADL
ncbi:thiazole synthase [Striga asiatica]|uniref:Thiazole synthase n=1 Tax=Striga asiatica TaxID=4170 RepID=A0A5A7P4U2_STRAF|nr:thiazole synthase [Striga asiatica]